MSTKRRRAARHWHEPHLRLELMDLLLEGDTRRPDEGDPQRNERVYNAFVEFTDGLDESDLRALWFQHRDALLREWAARGGRGRPWGSRFDKGGQP